MFKLIVILAIAGTLALVGIQFVPVYIQNHAITKVAQDVVCLLYTSPSPRDRG